MNFINDLDLQAMERRARAYYRPGDRSTPAAMLADDLLTLIRATRPVPDLVPSDTTMTVELVGGEKFAIRFSPKIPEDTTPIRLRRRAQDDR